MASLGIAMALARQEMLGLLARLIEETRETSPFPSAALELSGFMDGQFSRPAVDLEDDYAAMLAASRYRDAAAGRTLDGPHRADLVVRHRDRLRQAYTALEAIEPPTVLTAYHGEYKQGIELEQSAFDAVLDYYTNYNLAVANHEVICLIGEPAVILLCYVSPFCNLPALPPANLGTRATRCNMPRPLFSEDRLRSRDRQWNRRHNPHNQRSLFVALSKQAWFALVQNVRRDRFRLPGTFL